MRPTSIQLHSSVCGEGVPYHIRDGTCRSTGDLRTSKGQRQRQGNKAVKQDQNNPNKRHSLVDAVPLSEDRRASRSIIARSGDRSTANKWCDREQDTEERKRTLEGENKTQETKGKTRRRVKTRKSGGQDKRKKTTKARELLLLKTRSQGPGIVVAIQAHRFSKGYFTTTGAQDRILC